MGSEKQLRRCGRRRLLVALVTCVLTSGGCRQNIAKSRPDDSPRVEHTSSGDIRVTITAKPQSVRLDRDTLLTLEVTSPSQVEVSVPDITDRLQGFILNDTYEDNPAAERSRTVRRIHMRLTPQVAREHRIAPIPISFVDTRQSPPSQGWFPTRPIVFETATLLAGDVLPDIELCVEPVWIRPPLKTVLPWLTSAILVCVLLFFLGKLLRRAHQEIQMRRLLPRERALRELEVLLRKRLTEKHRVKDFYIELTMIVRRYIERQHAIHAPEQTTGEFLAAAVHAPGFDPPTVRNLSDFLQAADLVKFAAHRPERGAIQRATQTAREYIQNDAPPVEGTD